MHEALRAQMRLKVRDSLEKRQMEFQGNNIFMQIADLNGDISGLHAGKLELNPRFPISAIFA